MKIIYQQHSNTKQASYKLINHILLYKPVSSLQQKLYRLWFTRISITFIETFHYNRKLVTASNQTSINDLTIMGILTVFEIDRLEKIFIYLQCVLYIRFKYVSATDCDLCKNKFNVSTFTFRKFKYLYIAICINVCACIGE